MTKTNMLFGYKKCLSCGSYHDLQKQDCPICGRYLYLCGGIYQPKTEKKLY